MHSWFKSARVQVNTIRPPRPFGASRVGTTVSVGNVRVSVVAIGLIGLRPGSVAARGICSGAGFWVGEKYHAPKTAPRPNTLTISHDKMGGALVTGATALA